MDLGRVGARSERRVSPGAGWAQGSTGVRLGRWGVTGAGGKPVPWRGMGWWGIGRRSHGCAGGITPGFHTALPGNTWFKGVSFFLLFSLINSVLFPSSLLSRKEICTV